MADSDRDADADSTVAADADSSVAADATTEATGPRETDAGIGSREVVVPLRLYKTVTVFSTLFAVVLVVAGFVLLDAATNRARAELSQVDPVFAALGLVAIAAGGLVYAFATRFRARGMGKDKDDADEPPDNG